MMSLSLMACLFIGTPLQCCTDLALVGYLDFADGIGRQIAGIIDCLHDKISLRYIPTRLFCGYETTDLSAAALRCMFQKPAGKIRVALLEDILACDDFTPYTKMPTADIRFAYSMVESNSVPLLWVTILNQRFDGVIVPSTFLEKVYRRAGVTIPLFVVPIGLYIDQLLERPLREPKGPFVFGFSGSFVKRKNHMRILESFARAFGDDPRVQLVLHGRAGDSYHAVNQRLQELNLSNVTLVIEKLSWRDYQDLLYSFDCCISLSGGEGYSLVPREAMAAGALCVLLDHTAHTELIAEGRALGIPALYDEQTGWFDCTIDDAAKAMRHVYYQYHEYAATRKAARSWVSSFTYEKLASLYYTLVYPQQVFYDHTDRITPGFITTGSSSLFSKYRLLAQELS